MPLPSTSICIPPGSSILFDTSQAYAGYYPQYINTINDQSNINNQLFDNELFMLQIDSAIKYNTTGMSHTFHSPGTYTFIDHNQPSSHTIIHVNTSCHSKYSQYSTMNYNQHGYITSPHYHDYSVSINSLQSSTSLDTSLIGGLIGICIALCGIILLMVYTFNHSRWPIVNNTMNITYKNNILKFGQFDYTLWQTRHTTLQSENLTKGLVSIADDDNINISNQPQNEPNEPVDSDDINDVAGDEVIASFDKQHNTNSSTNAHSRLELTDSDDKSLLNELSANFDFEGFDFSSLYTIMDETKSTVTHAFHIQDNTLQTFYDKMSIELDHIKSVLSVKLHVQLSQSSEGYAESIDRLVSGELLARQSYHDLSRCRHTETTRLCEQLHSAIRNITDDYYIYAITELVRLVCTSIQQIEYSHNNEQRRRKLFASHVEIIGQSILDALITTDTLQESTHHSYITAYKLFAYIAIDIIRKIGNEQKLHATAMEQLEISSIEKRTYELDRYHLQIVRLCKEIQVQLTYLDERVRPINEELRECESKIHSNWVYIQGTLLEERFNELLLSHDGKLFRGINPDLAKVLAGLLGMKNGMICNPATGIYQPRERYNGRDPFCGLLDPGWDIPYDESENENDSDRSEYNSDGERVQKQKKKKRNKGNVDTAVPIEFTAAQRDQAALELQGKRDVILNDDTLSDSDKQQQLDVLANHADILSQLFGADALNFYQQYIAAQHESDSDTMNDAAEIARIQAELQQKRAELEEIELQHSNEYNALQQQLQHEDNIIESNFEIDLSKLDSLLRGLDAHDHKLNTHSNMSQHESNKQNDTTLLLNEFEIDYAAIKQKHGDDVDPLIVKSEVKAMFQQKRAELKAKRLEQLKMKHKQQKYDIVLQTSETQELLHSKLHEQNQLNHVIDAVQQAQHNVNQINNQLYQANNHEQTLNDCAELLLNNTIESCLHELQLQHTSENRLAALHMDTHSTAESLLQLAEHEKLQYQSQLNLEHQRQKQKLQQQLLEQHRKQLARHATEPNSTQHINKILHEHTVVHTALNKFPVADRHDMCKKVIETVMKPRHTNEHDALVKSQLYQRSQYIQESLASSPDTDYLTAEHSAGMKYDELHCNELESLNSRHIDEIRDCMIKLYPDELFDSVQWQEQLIRLARDSDSERQRRAVLRQLHSNNHMNTTTTELPSDQAVLLELERQADQLKHQHALQLSEETDEIAQLQAEYKQRELERIALRERAEAELKQHELDDMNDSEKNQLIQTHKLNVAALDRAMNTERMKQADALAKQLEDKKKSKQSMLVKQRLLEEKSNQVRMKLQARQDKRASMTNHSTTSRGNTSHGKSNKDKYNHHVNNKPSNNDIHHNGGGGVTMTTEQLDELNNNKLMLLDRLTTIESMVSSISSDALQWRNSIYIDGLDQSQYQCSTSIHQPVHIDTKQLSTHEYILYRYGQILIDVFHSNGLFGAIGVDVPLQSMKLCIASELPVNRYTQTAYTNSFHYNAELHQLSIRHDRLSHVGSFILVLVHCIAHITCLHRHTATQPDSTIQYSWDDRTPKFNQIFHQLLQHICTTMYYSNTANKLFTSPLDTEQPITEDSRDQSLPPHNKSIWSHAIKDYIIDELIELHPLYATSTDNQLGYSTTELYGGNVMNALESTDWYTEYSLQYRLQQYEIYQSSTQLYTHLQQLESAYRGKQQTRIQQHYNAYHHTTHGIDDMVDDNEWRVNGCTDHTIDIDTLQLIDDSLDTQLIQCITQLHQHTTVLHTHEKQLSQTTNKSIQKQLHGKIIQQKCIIEPLQQSKLQLIARMNNIQHAIDQVHGKSIERVDNGSMAPNSQAKSGKKSMKSSKRFTPAAVKKIID